MNADRIILDLPGASGVVAQSTEEAAAIVSEHRAIANARLRDATPEQQAIEPGDFVQTVWQHPLLGDLLVILGRVWPDSELQPDDLRTVRAWREVGYLFGRWWSRDCKEGEFGFWHRCDLVPVAEDRFRGIARANRWEV